MTWNANRKARPIDLQFAKALEGPMNERESTAEFRKKPTHIQTNNRRLALGLKQKDMLLRIGISRQQYQHLESRGNPGLNTLALIAKGLKSELMLIPEEKLSLFFATVNE